MPIKKEGIMYKVKIVHSDRKIAELDDAQLICSYYFLKKTFNYLYKKKLRNLNKRQKKAIIHDLRLFESIKKMNYSLRCLTPQKWLENWSIYNGITAEIERRNLSIT